LKRLKDFIGSDLTRVTIPVWFNEPTSFLHRMAEACQFYSFLDKVSDTERQACRCLTSLLFSCRIFDGVSLRLFVVLSTRALFVVVVAALEVSMLPKHITFFWVLRFAEKRVRLTLTYCDRLLPRAILIYEWFTSLPTRLSVIRLANVSPRFVGFVD
jgi:hypothetical protein